MQRCGGLAHLRQLEGPGDETVLEAEGHAEAGRGGRAGPKRAEACIRTLFSTPVIPFFTHLLPIFPHFSPIFSVWTPGIQRTQPEVQKKTGKNREKSGKMGVIKGSGAPGASPHPGKSRWGTCSGQYLCQLGGFGPPFFDRYGPFIRVLVPVS